MSDRKRILIVGVGSIGERHVRCFQTTGRTAIAICEVNAELRKRIAPAVRHPPCLRRSRHGPGRVLRRCRHRHAGPSPHSHGRPACRGRPSTSSSKKPLSTSLDGIDGLETAIRERNLRAAVAYVLRHEPALAAMREALCQGRFGKPVQLVAACGSTFPPYRPAYRKSTTPGAKRAAAPFRTP